MKTAQILPVLAVIAPACKPDLAEPPVKTDLGCATATRFSVAYCLQEDEEGMWYGLWDECFNLEAETSWEPAQGIVKVRTKWEPCAAGFKWVSVDYQCEVPAYTVTVQPELNYWLLCITFPPDECLAETVPNCHHFVIPGIGCDQ